MKLCLFQIKKNSLYLGTVFTQILGGIAAQWYGGKRVLLVTTLLSAAFLAITPIAVSLGGSIGLILTRVAIGILHGPLVPSISALMITWIPTEERARSCAIAYMGINVNKNIL